MSEPQVMGLPGKPMNLVDKTEVKNYEPGRAIMENSTAKIFNKTAAMKETLMFPQDRSQGGYSYDILTGSYRP